MRPLRKFARLIGLSKEPEVVAIPFALDSIEEAIAKEPRLEAPRPKYYSRQTLATFSSFFRRDGALFGIVNRIVRGVTATEIVPKAEDERVLEEFREWLARPQLAFKETLRAIVQDVLVYGNAWIRLLYNEKKTNVVKFQRLDPEVTNFKRDEKDQVILDEYGKPETIIVEAALKREELPKKEVAHFAFFRMPYDLTGLSPMESIYQVVKYKSNIERAVAEGAYRMAFAPLVVYVGAADHPPGP